MKEDPNMWRVFQGKKQKTKDENYTKRNGIVSIKKRKIRGKSNLKSSEKT